MFYFDSGLLAQYLDQKLPLKVFANHEWYEVADMSDLSDKVTGIGYDQFGGDHRFDYRDIEQIKIGNQPALDLKGLQDLKKGQEPKPVEKTKSKTPEEGGDEEMPAEEPEEPPKEKEPDLSWFAPAYDVGRNILSELKKKRRM